MREAAGRQTHTQPPHALSLSHHRRQLLPLSGGCRPPSLRTDYREEADSMPRSFLVKKHQSGSKKPNYGGLKSENEETPCNTHEDSLLHSDIPPHHHHPASCPQLPHRAQSISSTCCTFSLRTDRLHLPSSPNTSPLSFLYPYSEAYSRCSEDAYKQEHSCTKMDVEIQCVTQDPRRTESLLTPSIPLLALFPAVPPGSSTSSSQEHFECLDCHKEYLSYSGLPKHKQLYCEWSSKKCFSCKYCEKEYASLGALKMHIRTHTLPCVCKLCGKAFSRPWLLQGHIRTHTGEKPFSCLHCSRAFADRSNLRAHLQTHSEVKKYQCASCYKTFSRISLLAKHQEAGCPLS